MNAATIRKIKERRRKEQEARLMQAKVKFFAFYVLVGVIIVTVGFLTEG
jgi:hypothetical protein